MTKYTEEQFLYFTTSLKYLVSIKEDQETYWYAYKKLQNWLQEQKLSTAFISWVEKRLSK
ncbi:hypothetical protein J7E43_11455 [Bacillus sp. ISL-8]|nr:hypothetical protein [Bacillus sp. ISL-8]